MSDLNQAQELAWDAMEEPDPEKRKALAKKALTLSEDCAEAHCLLAQETKSLKKAIELYRIAVDAGKRAIGPKDFKDLQGHFWGHIETRPFMRAKECLAQCLVKQGNVDEAISHYQEMLELNPHDNQGIRHDLVLCLFRKKKDEQIEKLFDQYSDDAFVHSYYHHALWLFRKQGASKKSNERLKQSIEHNPHVPKYLLSQKKIPKIMPEYMQLGGDTEAMAYAQDAQIDWKPTYGALIWLLRLISKISVPSTLKDSVLGNFCFFAHYANLAFF